MLAKKDARNSSLTPILALSVGSPQTSCFFRLDSTRKTGSIRRGDREEDRRKNAPSADYVSYCSNDKKNQLSSYHNTLKYNFL